MENQNTNDESKSRTNRDFIKLAVGSILVIVALLALKYLMSSLGLF